MPLLCHNIQQHNSSLIYQQTRKNTLAQSKYRSIGNPTLMTEYNVILRIRHIPGKFNIFVDHLPRLDKPLKREWSLDQMVANCILQMLRFPSVDLFATPTV